MKKKEFKKKLSLNKESISNLNNQDLDSIKGGVMTAEVCFLNPSEQISLCKLVCE